jgi:hypothetical protein
MSRTYPIVRNVVPCFVLMFLVVAIVLPVAPVLAQAALADAGAFLIRFQPGITPTEQAAVLAALDVRPVRWLTQANVVQVAPNHAGAVVASSALDAVAPYIEYVEADAIVTGDLAPNDTAFTVVSRYMGRPSSRRRMPGT